LEIVIDLITTVFQPAVYQNSSVMIIWVLVWGRKHEDRIYSLAVEVLRRTHRRICLWKKGSI